MCQLMACRPDYTGSLPDQLAGWQQGATRPDSLPAWTKHMTMTPACLLFLTVKKWSHVVCQWGDFVQVCRTHTFGTRCYAHSVLHLYKMTILIPADTMSSSQTQSGVPTVHHEVCTLTATAKGSLSLLDPVQVAFTCSNNQHANWLFSYGVTVYKSMFVEGHTIGQQTILPDLHHS